MKKSIKKRQKQKPIGKELLDALLATSFQQELLTALDERSALASRLRKPRAAPGREPARYQWCCFQKYMAVLEHDTWAIC